MGEGLMQHPLLLTAIGPKRDIPGPGVTDRADKDGTPSQQCRIGLVVLTDLPAGEHSGKQLADVGAAGLLQLHIDQPICDEHPRAVGGAADYRRQG